jgi:hypothetical protein
MVRGAEQDQEKLPNDLEDKLWVEINKIEEEEKMPYVRKSQNR